MFLERLFLKNFKSFGGSHELRFAPGFTAVVGPNGSGKSNLLDALRWVLGDGSASRLRITRLGDLAFQGSASLARSAEAEASLRLRELSDGVSLEVAGLTFTVDHAPGHTEGSVMFRRAGEAEVPPLLLSGDVLFEGSIGRTDLPGGDHAAMLRSLESKVLPLDDATVVLPGHGATTTIARERATNPYLTALAEQIATPPTPRRGM